MVLGHKLDWMTSEVFFILIDSGILGFWGALLTGSALTQTSSSLAVLLGAGGELRNSGSPFHKGNQSIGSNWAPSVRQNLALPLSHVPVGHSQWDQQLCKTNMWKINQHCQPLLAHVTLHCKWRWYLVWGFVFSTLFFPPPPGDGTANSYSQWRFIPK